jgi:VWFA-related protein
VDVVVRNKSGAVTGLTKEDFALTDKGKEQRIDAFAATAARRTDDTALPLSPGVGSNRVNWRGEVVQSASIILFDRLNTSTLDQATVHKQVLMLLSSLKETDIVGFYSLGRELTVVHDFTDNPLALARAAARLTDPGSAAPADPAEQATVKRLDEALIPAQGIDATVRVSATHKAFQSIGRHLSGLPGRKNLVWIARSFPTTFGSDFNRRSEYEKELNAAISTLQEENVALYAINPSGAGAGQEESFALDRPQEGRLMPGANAAQSLGPGAISDFSTQQTIAEATGGVAFHNGNEIESAIRGAMAEQEFEYTLGFYPDDKTLDGRLHDLNIKLAKKSEASGVFLRYRKKYVASTRDTRLQTPSPPELASDPLNATAIQLAAYAQPDPARPGFQKVDVAVDVNDLKMEHRGDHWIGAFDLGVYIEGAGALIGSAQTINLDLTEEQRSQAVSSGLTVGSAIDTKKQAAKLRVVVRDRVNGSAGAVRISVAAP